MWVLFALLTGVLAFYLAVMIAFAVGHSSSNFQALLYSLGFVAILLGWLALLVWMGHQMRRFANKTRP
jgi:threonine/homoserine/homoserine lactone efflux protein